jgi:hypothetical protein
MAPSSAMTMAAPWAKLRRDCRAIPQQEADIEGEALANVSEEPAQAFEPPCLASHQGSALPSAPKPDRVSPSNPGGMRQLDTDNHPATFS